MRIGLVYIKHASGDVKNQEWGTGTEAKSCYK